MPFDRSLIFYTRSGHFNYIGENIGALNRYQDVGTKILKRNERFIVKVVWSSKCQTLILMNNRLRTPHFVGRVDEVASFGKRIRDSLPVETWGR